MFKIYTLICIFLIIGCDVGSKRKAKNSSNDNDPIKEETSTSTGPDPINENVEILTKVEKDSDFDGISDKLELEIGKDPFIANYPVISVYEIRNSRILSKYKNEDNQTDTILVDYEKRNTLNIDENIFKNGVLVQNSIVENKISSLIYSKIFTPIPNEDYFPSLKDGILGEYGCISDLEYFKKFDNNFYKKKDKEFYSSTFEFGYSLFFQNLDNINFLELLESRFRLYSKESGYTESFILKNYHNNFEFGEYTKQVFSEIFFGKITLDQKIDFVSNVSRTECLYLENPDFMYKKGSKEIRYSQLLSDIENELAHIYFSVSGKTYMFNVTPSAFNSVNELFDHLGVKIILDKDNDVFQVNEVKNELVDNLHITDIREEILKFGRWEFVSSAGTKISENLKSGQVYVLAFRKLSDLITNAQYENKIVEDQVLGGLSIDDIFVGDELWVFAERYTKYDLPADKSEYISGKYYVQVCTPMPPRPGMPYELGERCISELRSKSNGCFKTSNVVDRSLENYSTTKKDVISSEVFSIYFGKNKRVILPIFESQDGVYFKINVQENDIEDNKSLVILTNPVSKVLYPVEINVTYQNANGATCDSDLRNHKEILNRNRILNLKASIIRSGVIR